LVGQSLPFGGNINFNAHHSPMGAFMSFTCGHFDSGGGIGAEIGKPAAQNVYVGVKHGDRKAKAPIWCLPFFKGSAAATATSAAASYQVENSPVSAPMSRSYECYPAAKIRRHYGWATDSWETADFRFNIYSPFGPMPQPTADVEALRAGLLPAVVATLEVDNRKGTQTKTAVFAIDFVEPGTRLIAMEQGSSQRGFAWRRNMGVLGMVEGGGQETELLSLQRWSVAEGLSDVNMAHALGNTAGLALEVPAGTSKTLVLCIGTYLDGVVTTGIEGRYFYTRCFSSLEDVLGTGLARHEELRTRSARLDSKLENSGLSKDQQFLIAHGTRSYYGCGQLLDVGGEAFWVVNEGEYCMMNTLDLSVDHAFWELEHNPWVVANVLNNFVRRYSYHDEVRSRGGQVLPGGISFCHDMGVNNNFSPAGTSSYELAYLNGCFSFMTQEQLCNWVLIAACYVAKTADMQWLLANGPILDACAQSMRARANPRTGLMVYDSSLCAGGQEITTYDSLDESLGQSRANTYLATKCWATWLALDVLSRLRQGAGEASAELGDSFTDELATLLSTCAVDGTIPAVLEKDNAGYQSRILPVIEALIYPAYWLDCLRAWPRSAGDPAAISAAGSAVESITLLETHLRGPFIEAVRDHTLRLLRDPARPNLFADGGLKLSSTSNNSWMSKIAIVQYVARVVLGLTQGDEQMAKIFRDADAAHARWQTDGSGYWACSDQFVSGEAKGSRYYPRIITCALWMDEPKRSGSLREPRQATPIVR
jgi:hypothetical protein